MRKIRSFAIAIIFMLLVALITLLVVSMFTYQLKWQADKAMIGIIVAYVLAGLTGGFCMRKERKMGIGRKAIEAVVLSAIFMSLLVLCSCIGFQIPFEFTSRFWLIWLLVFCSAFISCI